MTEELDVSPETKAELEKVVYLTGKKEKKTNLTYFESLKNQVEQSLENLNLGIPQEIVIHVLMESIRNNDKQAVKFAKYGGWISAQGIGVDVTVDGISLPSKDEGSSISAVEYVYKIKDEESAEKLIESINKQL